MEFGTVDVVILSLILASTCIINVQDLITFTS